MAKRKSQKKSIIAVSSVLGVVSFLLVFLIYPNILAQEAITTQTIEETIQEGIDSGLLEIPFACASITECEDVGIEIEETVPSIIEEIIDPAPVNITEAKQELICEDGFEKIDEQCIEIPPPPPPPPPTLELVSTTIKIDNLGERFETTMTSDIPLLAFFVDDPTNREFDKGRIEHSFTLKSDPNVSISGNAKFDILIGNTTIFTEPVPISISGITNQNGTLDVDFVSPIGGKSQLFTFSFEPNADKFVLNGVTQMKFVVNDLSLQVNGIEYGLQSVDSFTFDIARDPNRILIEDTEGNVIRVFPSDDRLRVASTGGSFSVTTCSVNSVRFGCQTYRTTTYKISANSIGAWTVSQIDQSTGNEIELGSGGQATGLVFDQMIQRNQVYKVTIAEPSPRYPSDVGATITFKTPEERMDFYFGCTATFNQNTGVRDQSCNYQTQAFLDSLLPP